mgnify:CR=1 FL=1
MVTAERIAADSAIRARRTLRVYQTLELPYARTLNKTAATGNSTTYYEHDIDKYPTNDFRNSLTGVVAGLTVRELTGTPGMFYASETGRTAIYARGMTPEYIVDGMPVYITQLQLDPEEIESMTFIRDIADKALFGSRASGGVINITTRRGHPGERRIRVGFESGVSVVDRSPEWVNGVEYAQLQNQARINSGYAPLYSNETIEGFTLRDANSLTAPNADYRSLMFKDTKPYYKANISFDGGSERLAYSTYLGYAGEGDIFKVGSTADFNRLTVRTHLNAAITRDLKIDFGFAGGLSFRRSPRFPSCSSCDSPCRSCPSCRSCRSSAGCRSSAVPSRRKWPSGSCCCTPGAACPSAPAPSPPTGWQSPCSAVPASGCSVSPPA